MNDRALASPGRERQRAQKLHRIAETGLRLFAEQGYEATTLDAIAAEAGISRRTFFSYFKSKEEILLAWQAGFAEALRAAVLAQPAGHAPLETVENALLAVGTRLMSSEAATIDRVMRSSETLRIRRLACYMGYEEALFEALCERWPEPSQREPLRIVAMMAFGATRVSLDAWGSEGCTKPLNTYIERNFAHLAASLPSRPTTASDLKPNPDRGRKDDLESDN